MKTPQLKLHSRGVWFARYRHGGKTLSRYFTKDKAESRKLFAAWLSETWAPLLTDAVSARGGPKPGDRLTLIRIGEAWLTHIQLERGPKLMRQYRSAITNFLHLFGALPAPMLTLDHLAAHKADLADDYHPTSVIAYMKAVKRMLSWAARRRLMPPLDLQEIRLDRPPRPAPIRVTVGFVRDYINASSKVDPRLPPLLSLIYLTCGRPSEVFRLVAGDGRIIFTSSHGQVFETASKTQASSGSFRYLPLTPESLAHLTHARRSPFESCDWFLKRALRVQLSGYSGAKVLRSWGASELRQHRIPREEIRRVLGHASTSPLDHYVDESWSNLLQTAARLTLQPASSPRRSGATPRPAKPPPAKPPRAKPRPATPRPHHPPK